MLNCHLRLICAATIVLAVTAAGIVLAHFACFGADVCALGGPRASAEPMGVPIASTTIRVHALSGLRAGLAGIVFSLYTSAGYPLAAVGVELDADAAAAVPCPPAAPARTRSGKVEPGFPPGSRGQQERAFTASDQQGI